MSLNWKTLPSLTALRAFDATARHGGFAGAARALNVTHAAVAQQVRALEDDFGLALAVRTGRTVKLTPAGARLASALAEGFGTIANSVEILRSEGANRALRIVVRPYLVDRLIVPNLAQFWDAHPGVEISILPLRDFSGLQPGSFDLAIPSMWEGQTPDMPDTEFQKIARVRAIAIAAPSLIEKEGRDLTQLPWLWHEEDMDLKLSLMKASGLPVERLKQVRIGSPNLQAEAVRRGIGVGLFNARIAHQDIEAGYVVELPLPNPTYVAYYAAYPRGPQHPMMTAFVDWLKALF
jgi:LysR family glycine cleavage system transcriptional activator